MTIAETQKAILQYEYVNKRRRKGFLIREANHDPESISTVKTTVEWHSI